MDIPKISVVTVCYNAVDTIEETMLSVLNQSYDNIQYIIIDGGSTDGTKDVIKKYSDKLAYWVSEHDQGIFDAMNKGLDIATGDYINFLNSGDLFFDNTTIAKIAGEMRKKGSSIYYGDVLYKNNEDFYKLKLVPFYQSKRKLRGMGMCHQAIFLRTDLAKKYKFDRNFKLAADYNMVMKIYDEYRVISHVDLPIVVYNLEGVSALNWKQRLYEEARICGLDENDYRIKLSMWKLRLKNVVNHFLLKCKLR